VCLYVLSEDAAGTVEGAADLVGAGWLVGAAGEDSEEGAAGSSAGGSAGPADALLKVIVFKSS
jgi:hypothetical protein